MNPIRFSPPQQDEAIVAWLMAKCARRTPAVLAKPCPRPAARQPHRQLMNNHQPYQHAFAALIDGARGADAGELAPHHRAEK